jgi:hypothetical protein
LARNPYHANFMRTLEWGQRDADRRAKQRAAQERRERQQQERRSRRTQQQADHVVNAIVGTAFGVAQAVTFLGYDDIMPGHGGTVDSNWAQYSIDAEENRRTVHLEEATRDKGYRSGYTSI